jgi:hypothetical protein
MLAQFSAIFANLKSAQPYGHDSRKEHTLWHYRELANAFQKLSPGQLADELVEIVIVLENE